MFLGTASSLIKDCSNGQSVFQINNLGFWPDPAIRNENSTVSLDYTVPKGTIVSSGTVVYTLTYNYLPFSPSTEELCTNTKCPIEPGTFNESSSSNFPDLNGNVNVKAQWYDENQTLLMCYSIQTKTN